MAKEELPRIDGNKIFMSARDGIGLQELLQMIKKKGFFRKQGRHISYPLRKRRNCQLFKQQCDSQQPGISGGRGKTLCGLQGK